MRTVGLATFCHGKVASVNAKVCSGGARTLRTCVGVASKLPSVNAPLQANQIPLYLEVMLSLWSYQDLMVLSVYQVYGFLKV